MATIQLRQAEYSFGVYHGTDGKRHLGFDIASQGRMRSHTHYVDKVEPKTFWRGLYQRWRQGRRLEKQREMGTEMAEGPLMRDTHV